MEAVDEGVKMASMFMERRSGCGFIICVCMGVLLSALPCLRADPPEVAITDQDFKKMDVFEGTVLSKADKIFSKKEYRQALAEYDSFILTFPKSSASAYAVFRKARCLQLDNKRYEAVKAYNEVLDYFPNAITYASAALYYMGECQFLNGDLKEAMKAWAEMASDKDYNKHYLAASAINRLAENLVKQDKPAEAATYYTQVAVDFRQINKEQSWAAINRLIAYYVRGAPNVGKLREVYDKCGGLAPEPYKIDDNDFWNKTRAFVWQQGNFQPTEKDAKEKYYSYWASAMEGKMADQDDFQIDVAGFRRLADNDVAKWIIRLDEQFTKRQKEDDYGRVIRWISAFHENKAKVQEYYGKLNFAKLTAGQVQALMKIMFDEVNDVPLAKNVFGKIALDKLTDAERNTLERFLWGKDGGMVAAVCASFTDADAGRMELLRYYHFSRNFEKGLVLANDMLRLPQFSKDANWMKAELLEWQTKFQEAIGAFQAADNPPENMFRIATCYMGLGKREQAIGVLQEIENFFANRAPDAAMRQAYIYRDTHDEAKFIAALRGVMKKYPKSGESSTAHQELQKLGIKIGGGVDAE